MQGSNPPPVRCTVAVLADEPRPSELSVILPSTRRKMSLAVLYNLILVACTLDRSPEESKDEAAGRTQAGEPGQELLRGDRGARSAVRTRRQRGVAVGGRRQGNKVSSCEEAMY